jgi:hypothetical protein
VRIENEIKELGTGDSEHTDFLSTRKSSVIRWPIQTNRDRNWMRFLSLCPSLFLQGIISSGLGIPALLLDDRSALHRTTTLVLQLIDQVRYSDSLFDLLPSFCFVPSSLWFQTHLLCLFLTENSAFHEFCLVEKCYVHINIWLRSIHWYREMFCKCVDG